MMSINEFAYRIGALSVPPGMIVKPVRRALRTTFVALAAAAIALGASPAIAENRDQVKVVFEHALPNVDGKRMVAVMVSYPPGGQVAVPSPRSVGLYLRLCAVRRDPQPSRR